MKRFLTMCLAVGLVGLMAGLVYAGTMSASATVGATVASPTLSIALKTDSTCSAPNPAVITLVQDTSYPAFMIAPSRADMALSKNWHYVEISANKKWQLEVKGTDLTGGSNTIPISNLRYWYSGTWAGLNQVITNPKSTADADNKWDNNKIGTNASPKLVYTCNTSVGGAKSYMQYQLDIATANAATYSGTITYQVTDAIP